MKSNTSPCCANKYGIYNVLFVNSLAYTYASHMFIHVLAVKLHLWLRLAPQHAILTSNIILHVYTLNHAHYIRKLEFYQISFFISQSKDIL